MRPVDLAPSVSGALEIREAEGRARALRALLAQATLSAQADGELFRLARRHVDGLRDWFDRETGWRLVVESETARLLTSYVPHGPTATAIAERHPARGRRGDPPSPVVATFSCAGPWLCWSGRTRRFRSVDWPQRSCLPPVSQVWREWSSPCMVGRALRLGRGDPAAAGLRGTCPGGGR